MAFAKQYYSSYKSSNGLDYYLEIWVDGFSGNASEITLGAGGPVISYDTEQEDRFSPIISSQCVLPFMVKGVGTQSFIQLLRTTYQERQVYLHLYRATSSTYSTVKPLWSGYLIMDLGSGEDVSFPYEQNLTFVDGLSVLKEIDFVQFPEGSPPSTPSDPNPIPFEDRTLGNYAPENMYWGPARYTYWIKEILLKSGAATTSQGASLDYGFTTAVNWYNGVMTSTSQSSDPLYLTESQASMFHTKDENNFFKPENCYEVLKELMRHWGCRITYWKHEFWIVQIPEYIEDESGFIDNPDNINSRQYNKSGTYLGSQDHLGDTYYTRYEQTIQSNQISKLVGTKYNYLPAIHRADATFLSLNSENHYGGFPFGSNATTKDIFQGRILNPSNADFLWISVPLNWEWDMTGTSLPNGHTGGWWCSIKFNLYAFQKVGNTTTTYYLQYDSSSGNYYWIEEANWVPLGNTSPKYIIKSRNLTETDYIGFQEQIPFEDSSGNAISMTGTWDFYMSMEDYGTSSSTPGSFYCRFSGYQQSNFYSYIKRNPTLTTPYLPTTSNVSGSGPQTLSGKVSWTNSLQDNTLAQAIPNIQQNPSGYNTGSSYNMDIKYNFVSPLKGFLQVLTTSQNSTYGFTNNTQITNSTNTESFSFGDLVWGDTVQSTARGMLGVYNGSDFVKTNPNGQWGRGTLSGTQTFTQILIDEFLTGQIKVLISPNMRLVVGEQNKDQTATASGGGTATRPRFVNPIGRLREFRTNAYDPEYIFRRGSFYSLFDEWDYEGYEILRDTITVTTVTNDIGGLGGAQDDAPIASAKLQGPVTSALMMNSPVAYVRQTVAATGSNVAVNGNFNVATGWTLGTGWSIDTTAKKANFTATGSTSDLTQSVLTQEKTFQINFTVVVTAGTLLVKAGSSGTTETITASGDYSIYLDCEGSSVIKFQAGTTFTGSITHVHIAEQKSLSSLPINSLGTTVFKTNDTFNLINSKGGEILPLTVSSNQGASDDTISVTSTALYDDIGIDSVLLINQDDLSAQYQNKTKGTVGGFDITATSIDSGSVAISSYIDDDSFGTASATSLATSESIKAYVDTQVGSADTLAEVLANGNTTGGTDISVNDDDKITFGASADLQIYHDQNNSFIRDAGVGDLYLQASDNIYFQTYGSGKRWISLNENAGVQLFYNDSQKFETTNTGISITGSATLTTGQSIKWGAGATKIQGVDGSFIAFYPNNAEKVRFLANGNVLIGTTTDTGFKLNVSGSITTAGGSANITAPRHMVADSNAMIYRNNDNLTLLTYQSKNITFMPNNSESVRFLANGNVLIGTTTDSGYKLNVNGTAVITDNLFIDRGSDGSIIFNTSGVNKFLIGYDSSPDGFRIYNYNTSSASLFIEKTTNNLGIGTDSPSRPLHVKNTSSQTVAVFDGGNNSAGEIGFLSNGTSGDTYVTIGAVVNDMSFSAGASEKMRLTSAGRLGIGITNPNTKLHVAGIMQSTENGNSAFYGGDYVRVFNNQNFRFRNSGGTDIANISMSGNTYFNGGNVGIGTTNPAQNFVVADATNGNGVELVPGATGTIQTFNRGTSSYNNLNIDTASTRIRSIDYTSFHNGSGFPEKMRLTSDGNLLIGKTSSAVSWMTTQSKQGVGAVSASSNKTIYLYADETTYKLDAYDYDNNAALNFDIGGNGGAINIGGSLTGTTATFSTAVNTTSSLNFTGNNAYIKVGSAWNTGVLNFLNGATTYLQFDVPNGRIKNNLGSYLTASSNTAKFGSFDNYSVAFVANNLEKMRLTSNGNLLIGTTTDNGYKLEVNGTGSFFGNIRSGGGTLWSDSNGGVQLGYSSSDATGYLTTYYNTTSVVIGAGVSQKTGITINGQSASVGNKISFRVGDSERMRITSGGNVLIGTTTDSGEKLKIFGTAATFKIEGDGVTSANLKFKTNQVDRWNVNVPSGRTDLRFTTGSTDVLTLKLSTGNVLIGTTTDNGDKLQIGVASSAPSFVTDPNVATTIASTTNGDEVALQLYVNDGTNNIRSKYFVDDTELLAGFDVTYSSGLNGFAFKMIGSEKMRLSTNGNLLIGTTTDDGSSKLQVNGEALFTGSLTFNQSSAAFINHNVNSQSVKFRLSNSSALDVIPFEITPTYMASTVDMYFGDSDKLKFGAGNDLEIFSDGNDGFINNETNHFYITNNANNCDLALRSDDGLGGVTDYIRLDGSQETVNVYKNLLINTTTDVGVPLYVNGVIRAVGGGIQAAQDYGFTLNDESGSNRYGLKFGAAGSVGGSNLLMLTNRSLQSATGGGEVAIGGNESTTGVSEVEIARFQPRVAAASGTQKMVTLESVLKLKEQGTPADPSSGEAVIWLDNNYDLKVKITGAEGTVTRILAQYEG